MMELIVLGLVAAIGVASYALWAKSRASATPLLDAPDRTAATLEVGDVVVHSGTDWIVEGVLALAEDGRATEPRGRLYRLADGAAERFLWASAAECDPAFVAPAGVAVEGAPSAVELGGRTFLLTGRATVGAMRSGAVGARIACERVALAEYSAGAARLVVLDWGGAAESFVGERIAAHSLELLPGH
jgi:hypothetical protein